MAFIGDVEVTVTSESVQGDNEVTERGTEDRSLVDNVRHNLEIVNITGVVTEDSWQKLKRLRVYHREGKIINYLGRNDYRNVVMEKFDTDHNADNRYGFHFTCTLKEMRVAKTKLTSPAVASDVKTQASKTKDAGTQTAKSKPRG